VLWEVLVTIWNSEAEPGLRSSKESKAHPEITIEIKMLYAPHLEMLINGVFFIDQQLE
jgi:hypothetical protein